MILRIDGGAVDGDGEVAAGGEGERAAVQNHFGAGFGDADAVVRAGRESQIAAGRVERARGEVDGPAAFQEIVHGQNAVVVARDVDRAGGGVADLDVAAEVRELGG